MPSYIEPAVIDMNPSTLKPILFTTYDEVIKYNLTITYEDSTTKTVELVQGDKTRPYKVVFKKEGKLVTAIGVPTIYKISESCNFCDFTNKVMDSSDLLIELDCSSDYDCSKVKFYLKDLRDIVDLVNEGGLDDPTDNIPLTKYPIYVNGVDCTSPIECPVDEDYNIDLYSTITRLGEPLSEDEYSDFTVFTVDSRADAIVDDKSTGNKNEFVLMVRKSMIGTEVTIIIKYFVKEINHPVFDQFTIVPVIARDSDKDNTTCKCNKRVLDRAVSTADMRYLGDGIKTALGTGLTPGYKQYRNSKSYTGSVMEEE